MENLQDGAYCAHLTAATVKLSGTGHPILTFQWKLDDRDVKLTSYAPMERADGSPNVKAIELVRKWAPEWDGKDIYWFSENLATAAAHKVKLVVANEPMWNDPSRTYLHVKWVNPVDGVHFAVRAAAEPVDERARLRGVPDVTLEPTMADTWRMWCHMAADCSLSYRDGTWIWCAGETGGGKDQVDFTPEDWGAMQERLRQLSSACTHA